MRHMVLFPALAASLIGCAVAQPPAPVVPPIAEGQCDAAMAQPFVGRRAGARTIEAARRAAGAAVARALRPDTMVTMEYRADRLNLDVDRAGVIRGVRCG